MYFELNSDKTNAYEAGCVYAHTHSPDPHAEAQAKYHDKELQRIFLLGYADECEHAWERQQESEGHG